MALVERAGMIADEITVGNLIAAASAAVMPIASFVASFVMIGRKVRRENETDAQAREDRLEAAAVKRHEAHEGRLKEIEITCRDFMPRREIEKALDHEKSNRVAGQQGMVDTQREQARVLGEMQREQARFGAQLEATSGAIGKLEATVERFVGHVTDKLEKMSDCLTSISRKVG